MKALKKQIEHFSILLAMLILCQSCKVYYKNSVTLQQAVASGKPTKIETNFNQTLHYRQILFEDGHYLGILKHKEEISRFPIIETNVVKVRLKNQTLSTIYSITLPITIGLSAFVIFMLGLQNSLERFEDDITGH